MVTIVMFMMMKVKMMKGDDADGWNDFTWPSRTVAIFHPCLRQRLATGKDGIIKLDLLVFRRYS